MLRLRPYKKCDAAAIAGWVGDETTLQRWCAGSLGHHPLKGETLHAYYAAQEDNGDFFAMTAIDETGPAGHMFMKFMDPGKTDLRFGFIIVDDAKRGMHYGSELLRLAIRYAFDVLKVERITLAVFENNPAARQCYLSAGFSVVPMDPPRTYDIFGEKWPCLEMELRRA